MEFPSPPPRRVSTPRWLDLRLVLGIVLVLAAVLVGAEVVARAGTPTRNSRSPATWPPGRRCRRATCALVDVQLPDDVRHDAAYLSDPDQAVGKVLTRPLRKGELVPAAVLAAAHHATTVSVPFAADAAPTLTRGQRIVVWLSSRACPSVVLLPDVTVQDVHAADSGGFSTSGTGQDVVLSVAAAARAAGRRRARHRRRDDPRRRADRQPGRRRHAARAATRAGRRRRREAARPDRRRRRGLGGRPGRGPRRRVPPCRSRAAAWTSSTCSRWPRPGRAGPRWSPPSCAASTPTRSTGCSPPRSPWSAVVRRDDSETEDRLRALGIEYLVPDDADPAWSRPCSSRRSAQSPRAISTSRAPGGCSATRRRRWRSRPAPATRSMSATSSRHGTVVAVWGPTGAPGRTTVAITLADELARLGQRACSSTPTCTAARSPPSSGLLDESPGLAAACRLAAGTRLDGAALAGLCWQLRAELRVLTGIPLAAPLDRAAPGRGDRGAGRRAAAGRLHRRRLRVLPGDRRGALVRLAGAAAQRRDPGRPRRRRRVVVVGAADPIGMQRLVRALAELRDAEVGTRRRWC